MTVPFLTRVVADVMSTHLVVLNKVDNLSTARDLFHIHEYNALPIISGKNLESWLTEYDLLGAFLFTEGELVPPYEEILARSVSTVMSYDTKVVRTTEPLSRVLHRMIDTRFHSYPVIDDAALLGIIARADILKGLEASLYER